MINTASTYIISQTIYHSLSNALLSVKSSCSIFDNRRITLEVWVVLRKGEKFLLHMWYPSYYSWSLSNAP
jgi:hypothetical protein